MLIAAYLVQMIASFLLLLLTLGGVEACGRSTADHALALRLPSPAGDQSFLPFLVPLEKLPKPSLECLAYRIATIAGPPSVDSSMNSARGELQPCLGLYLFTVLACGIFAFANVKESKHGSTFERIVEGISYMRRRSDSLRRDFARSFAMFLGGTTALLSDLRPGHPACRRCRAWAPAHGPAAGAAIVAIVLARRNCSATPARRCSVASHCSARQPSYSACRQLLLSLMALLSPAAATCQRLCPFAMIQLATPDQMRGRVGSLNSLFVGASNELGEFRAACRRACSGPFSRRAGGVARWPWSDCGCECFPSSAASTVFPTSRS